MASVSPFSPTVGEAGPSSEPKSSSSLNNVIGSVDVVMGGTELDSVTETLYVNNLNEKIKLDVMKQSLRTLFRQYGTVLDVVAHSSIRMRGQAFVSLATKESAAKAFEEVKGFPLYGKPIQLAYAKTESDALVKRKHAEDFDQHKEERLKRKKISRRDNPLRRKFLAQKDAAAKAAELALASGNAPITTAPRRGLQSANEYLPPNKILFIQNLIDEMDKDGLEAMFKVHPNLSEIRMIPGRKGIAFVEFDDENSASTARDALHNTKLYGVTAGQEEMRMKVSFAKQ